MRANFFGLFSGLVMLGSTMAQADENLAEDFSKSPETRWDYVADTVMGGVSSGKVQFRTEGDVAFAHLTGTVSTKTTVASSSSDASCLIGPMLAYRA